ncbi:hypothetical protein RCN09_15590 [Escherichia marmotae]|nr:hypothetical protein [Escherichia marmotae]
MCILRSIDFNLRHVIFGGALGVSYLTDLAAITGKSCSPMLLHIDLALPALMKQRELKLAFPGISGLLLRLFFNKSTASRRDRPRY